MTDPVPTTEGGFGLYAKAINAAVILAAGVLITALADNDVNMIEWLMVAVALLRGVLAFGVRPEWGKAGIYLPLIITAAIALITQMITSLQDGQGFSQAEIVASIVVFLSALGSTYTTPNAVKSDALRANY